MWREERCIWPFCCATAPWLLSIILKYFIQESTPSQLRFYYPRHYYAFERINPPLNVGTGWYLAVEFLFKGTKYVCGCREYCKAIQVSYISVLIVWVLNYNLGQVHFYCIKISISRKIMWSANPWFFCADRWRRIIQIRDSLFAKSLQAKCSLTFFRSSATALIHSTQTITFLISETPNCRLIFY